jgi:hypothetical protein
MRLFIILLVLAAVTLVYNRNSPGTSGTLTERIENECRRSYGTRGEEEVQKCRHAMTQQAAGDMEREKATETYNRIR